MGTSSVATVPVGLDGAGRRVLIIVARYARGEIDKEEFEVKKHDLAGSGGSTWATGG